jgi:hypothetical protein
MFLIVEKNQDVIYMNVDNIQSIIVGFDNEAESVYDRYVIEFQFMNGTTFEYRRFPEIETAQQQMVYLFRNAFEIGIKR